MRDRIEKRIELKAPVSRASRPLTFRMNDGGLTQQLKNIESYVAQAS